MMRARLIQVLVLALLALGLFAFHSASAQSDDPEIALALCTGDPMGVGLPSPELDLCILSQVGSEYRVNRIVVDQQISESGFGGWVNHDYVYFVQETGEFPVTTAQGYAHDWGSYKAMGIFVSHIDDLATPSAWQRVDTCTEVQMCEVPFLDGDGLVYQVRFPIEQYENQLSFSGDDEWRRYDLLTTETTSVTPNRPQNRLIETISAPPTEGTCDNLSPCFYFPEWGLTTHRSPISRDTWYEALYFGGGDPDGDGFINSPVRNFTLYHLDQEFELCDGCDWPYWFQTGDVMFASESLWVWNKFELTFTEHQFGDVTILALAVRPW